MANQTTQEVVILTESQKSAKAILAATIALTKVTDGLAVYAEQVEDLTEQINIKSNEIINLQQESDEKLRVTKVDLALKIRENEEVEFNKMLKTRGLTIIEPAKLDALQVAVDTAQVNEDAAVKSAVAKANAISTQASEFALKSLKLENSAATAKATAELEAKDSKIAYLETQIKIVNKMLDDERNARIEISKGASQPVINVGNSK